MKTKITKFVGDKTQENLQHELNVLQLLTEPWLKALYLTYRFIQASGLIITFYKLISWVVE